MGKKELTKEKILIAAVAEFSAKDYEAASTCAVAENAGVSKGLIFLHFKNKEGLYYAAAEYALKKACDGANEKGFGNIKDFFKRMSEVSKWKLEFAKSHFEIFNLLYKAYYCTPQGFKDKINVIFRKYSGAVTSGILEADFETYGFRPEFTKEKIIKYLTVLNMGKEAYFRRSLEKGLEELDMDAFFKEWNEMLEIFKKGMQK